MLISRKKKKDFTSYELPSTEAKVIKKQVWNSNSHLLEFARADSLCVNHLHAFMNNNYLGFKSKEFKEISIDNYISIDIISIDN